MARQNKTMLRVGEWCVNPLANEISRGGETARLEARTMRLLQCLAEHAGEVVSIDDLLSEVWPDVSVSPDSVYQAVTSLRRILGDDPRKPSYIATVPRMGYRMVARVSPWPENTADTPSGLAGELRASEVPRPSPIRTPAARRIAFYVWVAASVLGLVFVVVIVSRTRDKALSNNPAGTALAAQTQRSVAVLPFLDLTEGMKEGEFADGMTEELIDKLSEIPGVRIPGATSSFYYKDKQIPVADVAKALGVAYVLDGSIRKSGTRLRVAARLVRADSGYVVWSESYDRPLIDRVMVQEDIASEVTKALAASIDAGQR
jgi:transcriptional activator of cad operon